jgi:solute carrier family 25 phosphate transporter 23/24/25/41
MSPDHVRGRCLYTTLPTVTFATDSSNNAGPIRFTREGNWDVRRLPVGLRRAVAGGLAGAVGKTATAPLEAVKLQLVQKRITTGQAVRLLYGRGGVLAFFRGNGLDILRTMPAKGIELATFDGLKRFLLVQRDSHRLHIPENIVVAFAGAVSGVVSSIAVHPLETIRTRLVLVNSNSRSQRGALRCALDLVRWQGIPGLFRGLDASIAGVIPYAAIRLGTYDGLRRAYQKSKQSSKNEEGIRSRGIPSEVALLFGAVAGITSAVATFPLEVARRRLMAGGYNRGAMHVVLDIARTEGVQSLFSGVGLTILKQGPQYALGFAVYEAAKQALDV